MQLLKKFIKIGFIFFVLGCLALAGLYLSMRDELPSVESLKNVQWQTPMQIYSLDGKLISQFGEKKRTPMALEDMPQQLIDAILATEDDRFYHHFGVDPIGVMRAVVGKLMGQNKGGASTITMQVARNFFLTREQTYTRKIREVFLAFHIESLLTKDEILALYMNKIPLGHRAFGFGAAAQVYYGKEPKELTLPQIAVLAGLPKAPSTINPIRSPSRAKARRSVVLQRMLVSGYINTTQYEQANNAPITGKRHGAQIALDAPYIAEMAHQEMLERYGKEQAYTGGYKVYLTTPSTMQIAAQNALIENLKKYDQRHGYRGAIEQLRPSLADEVWQEQLNSLLSEQTEIDDQTLIDFGIEPLLDDEIGQALARVKSYQNIEAAVVTEVKSQQITIRLKDGKEGYIKWPDMAWARPYISDTKQGKEPENAYQIVNYGDVIWVEALSDDVQSTDYALSQLPQASSALVAISPDNGAIQAAVGGFSFKQSQFNRVTQAKRQVGSNIKPFIYSAALENGTTLASLVNDAPINQWDRRSGVVWRPKNSPARYDGPLRVRLALAQSKNVIAVRLLRKVGLSKIIDHLSLFGFAPDELPRDESLALGSASLTPLEVATGFASFANGGYLVEPYLIERIEDAFGNILYQANPALACDSCTPLDFVNDIETPELTARTKPQLNRAFNRTQTINNSDANANNPEQTATPSDDIVLPRYAERAISAENAFLITEALNTAIWGADWSKKPGWQGTGWRARSLKRRDIAGKTGTTNESKDAWFSGYSRRLVTTSWIGFDDHTRNLGQSRFNKNLGRDQITGKEFGAKSAQPAWIAFMKSALAEIAEEPFQPPEQIVSVRIDKASGKLTNKTDKSSLFEYFALGTAPTEFVKQDDSNIIFEQELNSPEDSKPEPEEEIF